MAVSTTVSMAPAEPRIVRHQLADRLFHWVMAAATFALLVTGLSVGVGVDRKSVV